MECVVNDNGESQCPPDFAPEINSDVSGIGVRISFYLQALFLGAYLRCDLYANRTLISSVSLVDCEREEI